MYKTTLLSVNKRFRNLFTAFLVFFLSALVFGSSSTIEDTYNFGLFYLHTEADSQSSDDVIVYGPITAEEAGYVYEEEAIVSSGTIETFPIGTLVVAMDNTLQEDEACDGHRDSMKESAKGRFFENCVLLPLHILPHIFAMVLA